MQFNCLDSSCEQTWNNTVNLCLIHSGTFLSVAQRSNLNLSQINSAWEVWSLKVAFLLLNRSLFPYNSCWHVTIAKCFGVARLSGTLFQRQQVAKQRGVSSFPTNLMLFISKQVSSTVIDLTYGEYIDEELPVDTGASSN